MIQIKKILSMSMVALLVTVGSLTSATAKAATTPVISYVGLGHALVAGDTRTFTATSATYTGKVQYRAFISYENHAKWTEVTTGYTAATDAKTAFVLPKTGKFALGHYKLSVWVKVAGTNGTIKTSMGAYDSYKVSGINCTNTIGATIGKIVTTNAPLVAGDTAKVSVTSNFAGKVQYKAYLSDLTGKVFTATSTDYSAAVDSKVPYVLPDTIALKVGTYRLSVWVKRAGETGVKTTVAGCYDNYQAVSLIVKAATNVDPNLAAAKTAVLALQTASTKDLKVSANLTAAEALVQPTKDAVAKVSDATTKITLNNSVTIATKTITDARTAFDNATTTVNVFDTTVASALYGSKVNVTLTSDGVKNLGTATQYQIFNGTEPISNPSVLGKATTVYSATKTYATGDLVTVKLSNASGVEVKTISVKLGESGTITVPKPVEVVTNATISPANFGANILVTSNKEGAVKYQIWNDTKAVTTMTELGQSTLIINKVAGDTVTVKLFDADGTLVETKTGLVLVAAN